MDGGTSATTAYAYDTCDRLVEVTYSGDRVDEIEPDPFGRVLGVTEGSGSAAPRVITYQRDPNGHVTAMGWASGHAGFNYDEFDRLTSWGTTEDDRRNNSYDPCGQCSCEDVEEQPMCQAPVSVESSFGCAMALIGSVPPVLIRSGPPARTRTECTRRERFSFQVAEN